MDANTADINGDDILCDNCKKDIAEHLDRRCSLISKIICDKEKQLKTVQQHKKSLIHEYVTGKKRVTEVN